MTAQTEPASSVKPITMTMRRMLLVASILVFIVGIELFILSDFTDRFFAWTIAVPLTAAFLGAAYWSSFFLEILASREHIWARARIAIPAVLTFTALTFVVTMIHLDKFHLGGQFELFTQVTTWVWILIYLAVPILMAWMLFKQMRQRGDPTREHPLPGWVRGIAVLYAVILILVGIGLLAAPDAFKNIWPWALTPLTGRAIGAWLIGLGIASAQVAVENDWLRVSSAMAAITAFGGLELIALLRYLPAFSLNSAGGIIYIVIILSMLLVGVYGLWTIRKIHQSFIR